MPLAAAQARALIDAILKTLGDYQAILISEYGKGVCTPEICRRLIEAARPAGIPVIVDPSHGAGRRDLIPPLARAALAAGAAGLMIETHPDPSHALSDGPQALPLPELGKLLLFSREVSHV